MLNPKTSKIPPKAFKYYYHIIECDNSTFDGIGLEFREDDQESADIRAEAEASIFGIYARAIFVKVI